MARGAIDHLVSLLILLAALSVSFSLYSQMIGAAIIYQRNHQVAVKATDLLDNILLSTGVPQNWSQISDSPLAFGLQQPETGGFTVSPFAPLRLMPLENPFTFEETDFNNVSIGRGASLFLPVDVHVTYSHVTKLLGVNGSYGFQLTVAPTLGVSVSQVKSNPLTFEVKVEGPGLPLSGAAVNGSLYYINESNLIIYDDKNHTETDSTGSALLTFSDVTSPQAYAVLVQAHLIGLVGVGFCSNSTGSWDRLIPLIMNYEQGNVALCASEEVWYNSTFLLRTQNFGFRCLGEHSSGTVKNGEPAYVQIPIFDPGILLVAHNSLAGFGMVMMPWGISNLGLSVTFGGDPSSSEWVATDIRQVMIGQVSYEVKLAVWSLTG